MALCIVGSLLSDYSEETLIASLEKEPLAVLEDDQSSVEKAIKTSFDLLNKPEQEAFILLSLFQGSFDIDAVQAVTKAECSISGALPISILRSLKTDLLWRSPMPADIRCIRSFSHTQRRLVVIGMTSCWQWAKNWLVYTSCCASRRMPIFTGIRTHARIPLFLFKKTRTISNIFFKFTLEAGKNKIQRS